MDETPDEPRRPDGDRRDQHDEPTGRGSLGGQPHLPDEADDDEEETYQATSRRGILSGGRLVAIGFAVLVLLGGGVALALNGGGSGGTASSSGDEPTSQEDAAFEFAACMRDNGLEDFPDPEVSGDGSISIGRGMVDLRDTEGFQAAQEACQGILDAVRPAPEGEQLTPDELAELRDQWHAVAQCVRDQGYDFADPEIDDYGRFRMKADGDGVEQAIEECAEEVGLGEQQDGEGGSGTDEEGGA
ncbi:MAG TPA: hypothetical protein VGJ86_17385 [Acidimicrobiales bacterium]|jgi:hypothetical protein